jgi:aryl-alcohol dehydrogenase-like predicted oxidoreductase
MRLALGTVQFGLSYGIANTHGQVAQDEIGAILATARHSGVDTLDTAIAYGDSEARLGQAGVVGFRLVSKLPKLESAEGIDMIVRGSLQRLGIPMLHGLLLHRSEDLTGTHAQAIHTALSGLKADGLVRKIGVSIYDPTELEPIVSRFAIDMVQAPYNVIDRRLETSGWLGQLKDAGVEVHTRSALLQGLLMMAGTDRPPYFSRWASLWTRWDAWLAASGATPLAAALGFALADQRIDRVVLGVDSAVQLREVLSAAKLGSPPVPAELASDDIDLINPARWTSK